MININFKPKQKLERTDEWFNELSDELIKFAELMLGDPTIAVRILEIRMLKRYDKDVVELVNNDPLNAIMTGDDKIPTRDLIIFEHSDNILYIDELLVSHLFNNIYLKSKSVSDYLYSRSKYTIDSYKRLYYRLKYLASVPSTIMLNTLSKGSHDYEYTGVAKIDALGYRGYDLFIQPLLSVLTTQIIRQHLKYDQVRDMMSELFDFTNLKSDELTTKLRFIAPFIDTGLRTPTKAETYLANVTNHGIIKYVNDNGPASAYRINARFERDLPYKNLKTPTLIISDIDGDKVTEASDNNKHIKLIRGMTIEEIRNIEQAESIDVENYDLTDRFKMAYLNIMTESVMDVTDLKEKRILRDLIRRAMVLKSEIDGAKYTHEKEGIFKSGQLILDDMDRIRDAKDISDSLTKNIDILDQDVNSLLMRLNSKDLEAKKDDIGREYFKISKKYLV